MGLGISGSVRPIEASLASGVMTGLPRARGTHSIFIGEQRSHVPGEATKAKKNSEQPFRPAEWPAPSTRLRGFPMTLKGKTAVVTGSTSGIGLGIAHALA